ncbi:MAG: peptide chain release factor N(5)-glutamine methyltransferase [Candidatus Doudnabacteria bacterium]|nr:peptide chain release factor N(5)-glutamine methyltransferase [Candidatus Doudnabacteria bacterium]
MTIKEALNLPKNLDPEVLLAFALKKDQSFLFANPDKNLPPILYSKFLILVRRRSRGWPVAYLTGHKEFFGLDFRVSPNVLIPRPETELLVELALGLLSPSPNPSPQGRGNKKNNSSPLRGEARRGWNVIDLGTGSGNIITSLAVILERSDRIPDLKFFATDTSTAALKVAKANARRHGVAKKIKFIQGNLLAPLTLNNSMESFPTLIIANLPYLTKSQLHEPSIRHEPKSALFGGKDGLKYYRELFKQLTPTQPPPSRGRKKEKIPLPLWEGLGEGFTLLLEHDPRQKPKLKGLVKLYLAEAKVKFHKDLSGRFRVAELNF